tara:strand:- start:140 stop:1642 length:1503 start_codon:yes stop_codon:yes gene_type:complete
MLSHAMPEGVTNQMNKWNNQLADSTGLVGRIPEGGIDEKIRQDEATFQQARADAGRSGIDAGRIVGNVGATLPLVSAKALQLGAKGVGLAGNVLRGGGQGVITGGAQPVLEGDFGEGKLDQLKTGAMFGAGGGAAAPLVSRIISPKSSPEAQLLLKEGVKPTAGQLLGGFLGRAEDKMMSMPIVGDAIRHGRIKAQEEFNRAGYKRALKGMDVDVDDIPLGKAGIGQIKKILSTEYDDLLGKMTFKTDTKFFDEMDAIRKESAKLGGREDKSFNSLLDELYTRGKSNTLSGKDYKKIEAKLYDKAKSFKGSTDPYQKDLGKILEDTIETFKGSMRRHNPDQAVRYDQVNKNFANYVRLSGATKSTASQAEGFTPSQLAMGVKGADKSVRKDDFSGNRALMSDLSDAGVNTLNSKIPDSGTASRLLLGGGTLAGGTQMAATAPYIPYLAGAAGIGSAPYVLGGRQLAAALLAKRPKGAKEFAREISKTVPVIGASSGIALN